MQAVIDFLKDFSVPGKDLEERFYTKQELLDLARDNVDEVNVEEFHSSIDQIVAQLNIQVSFVDNEAYYKLYLSPLQAPDETLFPMESFNALMTCPLCHRYLHNPITMRDCGHTMCYGCVKRFIGGDLYRCAFCAFRNSEMASRNLIFAELVKNCFPGAKKRHLKQPTCMNGEVEVHLKPAGADDDSAVSLVGVPGSMRLDKLAEYWGARLKHKGMRFLLDGAKLEDSLTISEVAELCAGNVCVEYAHDDY